MDLNDLRDLFGYVSLDATLQYAHINRPDYHEVYHRLHPRGRKRVSSSASEAGEADSSVVST
jgi:site-specific recombinase XerC